MYLKEWIVKGNCVDVIFLLFHEAFDSVLHDSLAQYESC